MGARGKSASQPEGSGKGRELGGGGSRRQISVGSGASAQTHPIAQMTSSQQARPCRGSVTSGILGVGESVSPKRKSSKQCRPWATRGRRCGGRVPCSPSAGLLRHTPRTRSGGRGVRARAAAGASRESAASRLPEHRTPALPCGNRPHGGVAGAPPGPDSPGWCPRLPRPLEELPRGLRAAQSVSGDSVFRGQRAVMFRIRTSRPQTGL